MRVSKSTWLALVSAVAVLTISATALSGANDSAQAQRNVRGTNGPISERDDRFPVAEADEAEPQDPVKKAKLKKEKKYYDKGGVRDNPDNSRCVNIRLSSESVERSWFRLS